MPSFVTRCPTCKKLTPHESDGTVRDVDGKKMQPMRCRVCKTRTDVYTGEDGEKFQDNIDAPTDSAADDKETP